ncbi:hypothetical protein WMY93_000432 [Mugilogobius chulae]|uniref:Galactosyltransferase N-terminal domain-containing protein n=1 Tax=Mugilogobius chulae TaxID=88201 RepID=A0AAW0QE85_9GOBI
MTVWQDQDRLILEMASDSEVSYSRAGGYSDIVQCDYLLMGRLLIEFSSQMTMERVQKENPNVTEGGRYTPPDCRPRWKVAIIIPFRHRENHLKYWLHYLHPILRRQRIDYGIYIINQLEIVLEYHSVSLMFSVREIDVFRFPSVSSEEPLHQELWSAVAAGLWLMDPGGLVLTSSPLWALGWCPVAAGGSAPGADSSSDDAFFGPSVPGLMYVNVF